ncbi:hypothetical protein EJ05DRAFT_499072 [Pseudovirgaria hyperparasitica]|uniref:Uncharacterized protein n=1 Tax=Pseudovirgaria hyperparasitica TaxID=470096 RepID=A0A6A6WCH5_9PEZI|nr:uncharacterized protein EJ05DRAFT_499072 [Pseudovirgaria hyperparasitica]KAF2759879.1 hypothetical protein EJ05DRAFT_499072 [Pseudovirgaria hyperparasitica]
MESQTTPTTYPEPQQHQEEEEQQEEELKTLPPLFTITKQPNPSKPILLPISIRKTNFTLSVPAIHRQPTPPTFEFRIALHTDPSYVHETHIQILLQAALHNPSLQCLALDVNWHFHHDDPGRRALIERDFVRGLLGCVVGEREGPVRLRLRFDRRLWRGGEDCGDGDDGDDGEASTDGENSSYDTGTAKPCRSFFTIFLHAMLDMLDTLDTPDPQGREVLASALDTFEHGPPGVLPDVGYLEIGNFCEGRTLGCSDRLSVVWLDAEGRRLGWWRGVTMERCVVS